MSSIQSVLKKASKHSDGGDTHGMPPTYQDIEMRKKHTADSVEYNLDHAEDHFAELVAQLGKLGGVDRGKCMELADAVCKYLDKVYGDVEKYKSGDY